MSGQFLRILQRPLLLSCPSGTAHGIKLGLPAVGADVSLHEIGLLDGYIEILVIGIADLDVIPLASGGLCPLDPDELSDTVVHMDDEVSFLQIYEGVDRGG